jgi:GntR family transcriptional repressor for pyruvate dehydrogenase complex
MPLKPVQKILVSDGILDQIREMIQSSELSPGQRLPSETSLAKHLSVSRSSLREALNALVHLGYLQRQNRGVYVAPEFHWRTNLSFHFLRSQEDQAIAAMIEVRKIVEPELSALAAKRAEANDLKALEESLRQMKTQVDDSNAFINSDHHFHLCIAKAAKNSVLGDFIEKIRDLLRSNISLVIQKSTISRRSLDYHQRIYETIKEGNAAQARKVMAAHIADIENEFLKILYRPPGSS